MIKSNGLALIEHIAFLCYERIEEVLGPFARLGHAVMTRLPLYQKDGVNMDRHQQHTKGIKIRDDSLNWVGRFYY